MFDMDGDGDIDQFDEELIEYDLQLIEDEIIEEENERRRYQELGYEEYIRQERLLKEKNKEYWKKSCLYGVLIAIGLFIFVFIFFQIITN